MKNVSGGTRGSRAQDDLSSTGGGVMSSCIG